MKKSSEKRVMRAEHDFRGGVRGKYARRYHQGCNIVVLDADVAERLPYSEAVNQALRALASIRHKAND